jgi:hypothetical protein
MIKHESKFKGTLLYEEKSLNPFQIFKRALRNFQINHLLISIYIDNFKILYYLLETFHVDIFVDLQPQKSFKLKIISNKKCSLRLLVLLKESVNYYMVCFISHFYCLGFGINSCDNSYSNSTSFKLKCHQTPATILFFKT